MNQLKNILIDGVILFTVSTVFVVVADMGFSKLKGKVKKDDPIVTAIIQADSGAVEKLVKAGKQVTNETDGLGRTALMRAAFANYDDPKIISATDAKRAAIVELLLNNGARIDSCDNDGWSALMWAAWSGLSQVVDTLLAHGASPHCADRQGNTALIIAAQRGHAQIVSSLLAKGADHAVANKAGRTALDAAKRGLRQYPGAAAGYHATVALLR
jgi:ankyrin repeat protein